MRSPYTALALGAWLLGSSACPMPTAPRSSSPGRAPAEEAATEASTPGPAIVSAHLSRVDDPELGGLDGVLVVFDVEVDAASLDRRAFVVSRASAGPTRPERARLAPASEDDENRSVLLVGELGDASDTGQPSHLAVTGPLFSEDGRRLDGLGTSIEPFGAPLRIVGATPLDPAAGRCEGAAGLVRSYWSDELRGVEPEDLEHVDVMVGGRRVHPVAFDDHASAYDEAGQDNVLDLCLSTSGRAVSVRVDAGVFLDAAGHANAGTELAVASAVTGT